MLEQSPVARDIAIVFLKRSAEKVPALGICDKIEILGWWGVERRADRRFTRVGNGPRRQASVLIRIVGRFEVQIVPIEFAAVLSR